MYYMYSIWAYCTVYFNVVKGIKNTICENPKWMAKGPTNQTVLCIKALTLISECDHNFVIIYA